MGSDRTDESTRVLWCGNLAECAEKDVVHELFLQAGPIERIDIPKDRDGRQRAFAFVTYAHEESVAYAVELFRGTRLYNRTLNLQNRGQQQQQQHQQRGGNNHDVDVRLASTVVESFKAMAYSGFEDSLLALKAQIGGAGLGGGGFDLGAASLQGLWTSRGQQLVEHDRPTNRFEPYRRGGGGEGGRDRNRRRNQHDDERNNESWHRGNQHNRRNHRR